MIISFANRIKNTNKYYFSKKVEEIYKLNLEGKNIINLGIGSPDLQPPKKVVEALKNSLSDTKAHTYQSYQGLPEFRKAIANFYKLNYSVLLNSDTEILPLLGSKEGILHISLATLNIGDEALIPNPGYPTYTSVTNLIGAKPILYSLNEANNYQPDLRELEKKDLSKVKLMWINYPHMPTGKKATKKDLKSIINFGKKHNILIINDNPYSFILNNSPLSILQVEGAKDISIELNSLSKSFNIAGWRAGILVGNSEVISAVLKVKTQQDSGMFYGIQKGAIKALETPKKWFTNLNHEYYERKKLIWQFADKLNCTYQKDTSGLFVWAKLPQGISSEEMVDTLLYEKGVFVAPGNIFGTNGEGYIRISLCATKNEITEAIQKI